MNTEEKLKAIESKIRKAVTKAQANGVTIASGNYNLMVVDDKYTTKDNRCCPLSTLALGQSAVLEESGTKIHYLDIISDSLGLENEADYFAICFDDKYDLIDREMNTPLQTGMYNLGRKMRAEYIK